MTILRTGDWARARALIAQLPQEGPRAFRSAVLQEAVGEAAGGLAQVQADQPGRVDAAGLQRAFELEPAARDVARFGRVRQLQLGRFRQLVAVLGHRLPGAIADAPRQARGNQPLGLRAGCGQATVHQQLVSAHAQCRHQ